MKSEECWYALRCNAFIEMNNVGWAIAHQYGRSKKITHSPKGSTYFNMKKESTEGKTNG